MTKRNLVPCNGNLVSRNDNLIPANGNLVSRNGNAIPRNDNSIPRKCNIHPNKCNYLWQKVGETMAKLWRDFHKPLYLRDIDFSEGLAAGRGWRHTTL